MKNVFLLQHSRETPDGWNQTKVLGVFTSRLEARRALERVKNELGFRAFQGDFLEDGEGFHIGEKRLDAVSWREGFFSDR